VTELTFLVDEAGCTSCAARVREALEPLGEVLTVDVDEAGDRAEVRFAVDVSETSVNRALAEASRDAGHAYRVVPGSFRRTSA
jgi:copper chaperone CopZ